MPPLITHLVIGERVYAQLDALEHTPRAYGAFLLGCVLVDANAFTGIDRRRTHLIGRLDEDGPDAFQKSCTNFLAQRGTLLAAPWEALSGPDRAFVAGYLCHLAADETWKAFTWHILRKLGIDSVGDLPVPGEVMLTAACVLSNDLFLDHRALVAALREAAVPDVVTHIPHADLVRTWDIARSYALDGSSPESYFAMLARLGKTKADILRRRRRHERCWDDAIALLQDQGGIESQIQLAVRHALHILPHLWKGTRNQVFHAP